jgi:4-hydroxybutyrate dehydrogenase
MATLTYPTLMEIDFGAIQVLGKALARNGITRPLICTDKGVIDCGVFEKVRAVLPNEVTPTVFDGTPGNPTEVAVREAAALYHENDCDGIIAIGGGSSIDLGKGVALVVSHDGPMNDWSAVNGGRDKIGATPPIIAIPTTAGTGSEVGGGSDPQFAPASDGGYRHGRHGALYRSLPDPGHQSTGCSHWPRRAGARSHLSEARR